MRVTKVRYNGGTESYRPSSDYKKLVLGQIYDVVAEEDLGFQTNYTLKGVSGRFNSCWFDIVEYSDQKETLLAIANNMPKVGERCSCYKLNAGPDHIAIRGYKTGKIESVETFAGDNVYIAKDNEHVYIVQVVNKN